MNSFLTLEDVNTVKFSNQGFWWHCIDISKITSNTDDFDNVIVDFCTVSREKIGNVFRFEIRVDNPLWTTGCYTINQQGVIDDYSYDEGTGILFIETVDAFLKIYLYMGVIRINQGQVYYTLLEIELSLNLKDVNTPQPITVKSVEEPYTEETHNVNLTVGYNLIDFMGDRGQYLLVNLLKTDFRFQCNQQLTLGKVNTVRLGALADYKPNGDLVGEYTPTITVKYGSVYMPVRFDTSLNDYVFDIDLTNKQTEGKVKFKVFVDTNEVLNSSETDVVLNSTFETINNESKLRTLFSNGGIGRLGSNITLTTDLTVTESVYLIGNNRTLNMQSHKIIVPSDMTFKCENTQFTNGKNTIQQQTSSNVELNNCSFTDCTGLGSVIDCQVNIGSLSESNDFNTILTNCTITNSDMAILHGGDLTVTGCTVTGKISDKNYPYFLYQTDGEAVITGSVFNLTNDEQLDYDIEFNSCIFICGETATINSLTYLELQNNNITQFISNPQNNRSSIDVTYYYPAIEDYVTLSSDNGYCHSVSGIDFVFKTNLTPRRTQ